jgi:membrane protease YdiL (CAAX protease family)
MNEQDPINSGGESGNPPEKPQEKPRETAWDAEASESTVLPPAPPEASVHVHDPDPGNSPQLAHSIVIEAERPASWPPQPDPWRGRDLFLFVGFSVIWAFLSGFLLLSGYAILRPWMSWKTSPSALVENTFFGLLVQLVLYGPLLVFIILLVTVRYRLPFWAGIRWRWPGGGNAVKLLLSGVLLALAVALGSALLPDRKDFPLEKMFSSPAAAYALGAFAVLIAPFMEELIFRGVLFAFFERLIGLRSAVVVSALLFAALHYPEYEGAWTHLGMILVVGVVFSLARALTGSLAPSFLLHTAYNGTFILALFLGTHHFRNLQSLGGAG